MTTISRRDLLAAGAAAALLSRKVQAAPAKVAVAVSSANGLRAVETACNLVGKNDRPVNAAVMGVAHNEADPKDMSVGYGGLPNEEGVIQLDSCVMDGTIGLTGAVAAIENIMHPAQVALKVMDRTDHAILVGKGAYRFARAHGFKHTELLTDAARKRWLKWKENLSDKDDWVSEREKGGTITCLARTVDGRMGGCTTTSGLAFKIPGRVGDSPIIGAGLYVDDTAGAAGCTGRGEACIRNCASFLAVEFMRQGRTAAEAALAACKRIAQRTKSKRLLDDKGRPNFNVKIYCLRNDGTHGAAAIWSGGKYAVQDAEGTRLLPAARLFER